MISYITKDEHVVPGHAEVHFHLGKFHYFVVEGCVTVPGAQRIPWVLCEKKMLSSNATWYQPKNSVEGRKVFNEMKKEFIEYIRTPIPQEVVDNPMAFSHDVAQPHTTTLVDAQRVRERKNSWKTRR